MAMACRRLAAIGLTVLSTPAPSPITYTLMCVLPEALYSAEMALIASVTAWEFEDANEPSELKVAVKL